MITTTKKIQRTLDRLNKIKSLTLTGYTQKVTALALEAGVDNGFISYLVDSNILINEFGKKITWNNKIPITFNPLAEKCYNEYYAIKKVYPVKNIKGVPVVNTVKPVIEITRTEKVKRSYKPRTNKTESNISKKEFSFLWGFVKVNW
tara:strand:+ start:179 stop:619 length:441 start_codon:yes stop_codon:yes gene_type:complete